MYNCRPGSAEDRREDCECGGRHQRGVSHPGQRVSIIAPILLLLLFTAGCCDDQYMSHVEGDPVRFTIDITERTCRRRGQGVTVSNEQSDHP